MATPHPLPGITHLLFDVFGTVVDWRGSTARQLHDQCQQTLASSTTLPSSIRAKASTLNLEYWQAFGRRWLQAHADFVHSIAYANINGDTPPAYKTIDEFMLESLPTMLADEGLSELWDEKMIHHMSRVLHRLDGWSDSAAGIRALNAAGYETITLSNGNREIMADMAAHAGLEWTRILSAADARSYKPDPRVYLEAAKTLGVRQEQCALVAAHLYDLEAARKCGWKSVFVDRVGEEKWSKEEIEKAKDWVDVWVTIDEEGLVAAAQKLGKADTTHQS